ncbi:MAG: porin [Acidimicrobiia bacterium]|nr:porin [Acidimicrobiia bacterium]
MPLGTAVRCGALLASAALLVSGVAQAHAQSPDGGAPRDRFVLSATGDGLRLVFGLVAQLDTRAPLGDSAIALDTVTVRKLRPTLSGRIGRRVTFKVMPDFGGGTAVIMDAYVDVRLTRAVHLRAGKDKTPVGYELLQGDAHLLFPERSLAALLVPNRDLGVQVQGDLGPALRYAAGVFRGVPDGTSSTAALDAADGQDVAARLAIEPFRGSTAPPALQGFGVHLGGSIGEQTGPLPAFPSSVGRRWFEYADGSSASGARRRVSPALYYYRGPLGAFAEYAHSTQRVAAATAAHTVTNRAWEVTASYVLTGEPASDRGITPAAPFGPHDGRWGAVQLLARYAELTVDPSVFRAHLAAPAATARARAITIGANWYPVAYLKGYATIERTAFEDTADAKRPAELVIVIRAQAAF